MKARATLASVLVLLALTAAVVGVAASPGFAATACGGGVGQPLLLGCSENSAPITTSLTFSGGGGEALSVDAPGSGASGVFVFANNIGVYGQSSNNYGVWGTSSNSSGVYGLTAGVSTQNGVYGLANDYGGSGVYGQNDGTGYGVGGRTTNVDGGTGVIGDAPNSANGIGVEADSATGTALHVQGKAVFSRSGLVTIPVGKSLITVTLAGVTSASMILATAQQNKGVYVKAAVPGSGSFTIRLTGSAPTGGLKVAYFVLN
jgi:hypothetical protein